MEQTENSIGYKYDFEIIIQSIKIDYKLPFNFKFSFKRGNQLVELDNTLKYDPANKELIVNDSIIITCTMKPASEDQNNFDITNPDYLEKKYKIYLNIFTKNGFKPAISGEINLADFISPSSENKLNEIYLNNKTFSEIIIKYKVKSNFIGKSQLNPVIADNNQTTNSVFIDNNQTTEFPKKENQDSSSTPMNYESKIENDYHVEEINLLKSVIEDLKKEKKDIFEQKNNQIENLKNQLDEINQKFYDINRNNEVNLKNLNELKNENKKLNEEIQDLKIKKKESDASHKSEIENFKQKIKDLNKEFQNEKEQLYRRNNEELDTLKKKYSNLMEEKEAEILNYRNTADNNETSVQREKEGLESLIRNLNNTISILEEKFNFKEKELENLKEIEDNNIGGMKSELNEYMISLKEKDLQLKESRSEINNLNNNINILEEKLKLITIEKDGNIQNFNENERKLKDNIIFYKQKLEEKDSYLQNILDDQEKLKYENEKLQSEIKIFEKNNTNDEDLFNQIGLLQIKAAEVEKRLTEEKDQEIKQLKKEIESQNSQLKKLNSNTDKEKSKTQSENIYLRKEIETLKQENKEIKEFKEKIIKLEKNILDMQNNLAIKKVEISQSEMEKEKLLSENRKILMEYNDQKIKIDNLEKDLIFTKQKLGDVLNELGEYENNSPLKSQEKEKSENAEKKKGGFSSFFSKKKKDS